MATIQTRTSPAGKTTYRVMVRLQGHPPQYASFNRLTDAKRWATQTEAAIREGRYFATSEAKRHTVGDMLERYAKQVLATKKASTQRPQIQQLAWWNAQIGDRPLADATPALIAECRDTLAREPIPSTAKNADKAAPERQRSAATVNRYLAALSHVFTVAIREWQWLETNPVARVTKPREPRGRVRFLDDSERERLLQACRESSNPDLYLAVVLSLSTGGRQQEILGLRWKQIDFARRVATLEETKNDQRRVLPLAGLPLELLRERSKVRRLDTDLIFPGRNPAKPVDLRTPFRTALKAAGIADFHWHDLRHSCASYLAMNGASLAELAEVLGHKTLAMVKRYSHLSEAHTAGVVERMTSAIFGNSK